MKVLGQYLLMVVSTLVLNRVHVFANFMFNLETSTKQSVAYVVRDRIRAANPRIITIIP